MLWWFAYCSYTWIKHLSSPTKRLERRPAFFNGGQECIHPPTKRTLGQNSFSLADRTVLLLLLLLRSIPAGKWPDQQNFVLCWLGGEWWWEGAGEQFNSVINLCKLINRARSVHLSLYLSLSGPGSQANWNEMMKLHNRVYFDLLLWWSRVLRWSLAQSEVCGARTNHPLWCDEEEAPLALVTLLSLPWKGFAQLRQGWIRHFCRVDANLDGQKYVPISDTACNWNGTMLVVAHWEENSGQQKTTHINKLPNENFIKFRPTQSGWEGWVCRTLCHSNVDQFSRSLISSLRLTAWYRLRLLAFPHTWHFLLHECFAKFVPIQWLTKFIQQISYSNAIWQMLLVLLWFNIGSQQWNCLLKAALFFAYIYSIPSFCWKK